MNPHSDKNIGQLRKHASSLGITMASRKKKDELLSLIAEREQQRQINTALQNANAGHVATGVGHHVVTPDGLRSAGTMYGQPITRAERDALRPVPVTLFDPRDALDDRDKKTKARLPRHLRRHNVQQHKGLDGTVHTVSTNVPRQLRRRGAMGVAAGRQLAIARGAL